MARLEGCMPGHRAAAHSPHPEARAKQTSKDETTANGRRTIADRSQPHYSILEVKERITPLPQFVVAHEVSA